MRVCMVVCVAGYGKWPCQATEEGKGSPYLHIQIQIDAPLFMTAWVDGSGCWRILQLWHIGSFYHSQHVLH